MTPPELVCLGLSLAKIVSQNCLFSHFILANQDDNGSGGVCGDVPFITVVTVMVTMTVMLVSGEVTAYIQPRNMQVQGRDYRVEIARCTASCPVCLRVRVFSSRRANGSSRMQTAPRRRQTPMQLKGQMQVPVPSTINPATGGRSTCIKTSFRLSIRHPLVWWIAY